MGALEIVLFTVLFGWLLTLELRYWRSFRLLILLDSIIKALTRYARERGDDA